jgi:hypothetical protein
MIPQTAADHDALRRQLFANGYTPLPSYGKVVGVSKWSRLDVTEEVLADWADREGFPTTGVRVDGDLLVLDFDIDCKKVLRQIDKRIEEEDPDLWNLMLEMPKRIGGGGVKYALFARRASGSYEQYWSKGYYKPLPDDAPEATRNKRELQRLEVFTGGSTQGRYMALYGAHTLGPDGETLKTYSWVDDYHVAEVPLGELPALTLKQVKYLVDLVSDVLYRAGWDYEVGSIHGKVTTTVSYTLVPEMQFSTNTGEVLSLEDLDAVCDSAGLRVAMGFVEAGAGNTSRGAVSRNGGDGRVQVWDFASATMYRPAVLDVHMKGMSLAAKLKRNPWTSRDPANFGDGDDRPFVDVGGGELTEASNWIARYLSRQKHLFDMGGRIVAALDGEIVGMDVDRLSVEIGRRVCCRMEQQVGNAVRLVEVDPPTKLVRMVASILVENRFRGLRAVTDVPVVRRDGTLVTEGYCKDTGLLVRAGPDVLDAVEAGMTTKGALRALWEPFEYFPFVGSLDRGGMLAALLTAVARPVLPTAPAFGMDAPTQGSGKSLLSRCVARLAGRFEVQAPLPVRDDDEVRKVLLSVLMDAPRAVVFDNMLGRLDSGALGAMLTAETFSGRVLGSNTVLKVPTSTLVLMNGNNLTLAGDMPRRVVTVRIDPKHDVPHARGFKFDPEEKVRTNRAVMLAAGLTLVQAAMPSAGKGRVGSFEAWDEMVGQTVRWVRDNLDSSFGDPIEGIQQAVQFDPRREELHGLLIALRASFGNCWFTAAEVCSQASQGSALLEGLDTDKTPTSRGVGKFLSFRKDGRAGGMTLQQRRDANRNVTEFRVWSDDDASDVIVTGRFQRKDANVARLVTMAPKV